MNAYELNTVEENNLTNDYNKHKIVRLMGTFNNYIMKYSRELISYKITNVIQVL